LYSLAVTVAIASVAIWLIWPKLPAFVPKRLQKWAMMGIALACLAPQFLFEIFFPRSFDITAWAKSIDYEFADFKLAVEFALLNLESGDVKFNGHNFPSAFATPADDDPSGDDSTSDDSSAM
jgi:hypothetical protein